ncbi:hypothetical protein AYO20_06397 [Fonsecaea nubica]|uniref:Uncharacterized protein n=1 Tax=Fonsecaea nubica TaxID=856822 RepID=A0A178CYT9_9EURO|nr:hypothetical protein AYO20_06397 [Fonsecaea nubica]OAL34344.1 hypothetical protein AYO20_06397 [Fonsecaea nubica]
MNRLSITQIATVPHAAHQAIWRVGEQAPREVPTVIYDDSNQRHPIALKLIPDEEEEVPIPLQILAQVTVPPGVHCYYLRGSSIKDDRQPPVMPDPGKIHSYPITSRHFKLDGGATGGETKLDSNNLSSPGGPATFLYGKMDKVHFPFKATGLWIWELYEVGLPWPVARCQVPLEIYFFRGDPSFHIAKPSALSSNIESVPAHVFELIELTIPEYGDLASTTLSPEDVKIVLVAHVVQQLWDFAGSGLTYDSVEGAPSYLRGSFFFLGSILSKHHPTCSCFDLGAFVNYAFKSFGRWTDRQTGQETDVFETRTCIVRPWGFIKPSVLIGTNAPCNNPFYAAFGQSRLVEETDPSRTDFSCHCFCLWRQGGQEKVIDICLVQAIANTHRAISIGAHSIEEHDNIYWDDHGNLVSLQDATFTFAQYWNTRDHPEVEADQVPVPRGEESFSSIS